MFVFLMLAFIALVAIAGFVYLLSREPLPWEGEDEP